MKNFEHLHVLQLLGVCFDEEAQPMVILPYMAKGDLRSYVKDKKNVSECTLLDMYIIIITINLFCNTPNPHGVLERT